MAAEQRCPRARAREARAGAACGSALLVLAAACALGDVVVSFVQVGVTRRAPLRVRLQAEGKEQQATGHQVAKGASVEVDPEEAAIQVKVREHQQDAARLDSAVEVRTLVQHNHGFAVISTNSVSMPGYPGGSVVGFAPDDKGRPLFFFSTMSTHTADLLQDGRCSLTVASKEFKGAADGRVNLLGQATEVLDESEKAAAREVYRKKHPGAFWIDFGDFKTFRMEVESVRFVMGFASAGGVTAKAYAAATPDAIAGFGPAVAKHMNDDHRSSSVAMVGKYVGIDVEDAEIVSLDSLGMFLKVSRKPKAADQYQQFKLRLPFIRPIQERKDLHTVIVEMSRASAEFLPKEKAEKAEA